MAPEAGDPARGGGLLADFVLESHHVKLPVLACEAWDRGQDARAVLATHGMTYVDRFQQPRARPEVAIERAARVAFVRLLRELALDVDARPPTIRAEEDLPCGTHARLGVARRR